MLETTHLGSLSGTLLKDLLDDIVIDVSTKLVLKLSLGGSIEVSLSSLAIEMSVSLSYKSIEFLWPGQVGRRWQVRELRLEQSIWHCIASHPTWPIARLRPSHERLWPS